MELRRFTTRDEAFRCAHCGLEVLPLGRSSRNHCPACLYSRHVDVNPGDRASGCGGMMRPVGVERDGKRGWLLVHRCERCGAVRRCRAAPEAEVQPDDMERIVELATSPIPLEPPDRTARRRGWREDS